MFRSRKEATCTRCNKPIHVDDYIKWARRGQRGLIHATCPVYVQNLEPKKIEFFQYNYDDKAKSFMPKTEGTIREIVEHYLLNGRKIEAIKYYRGVFPQLGLKDAKDRIDEMQKEMKNPPEIKSEQENEMVAKSKANTNTTDTELKQALEILGKHIPTALNEADIKKIVEAEFAKLPKAEPLKIDVTRSNGEIKRIDNAHVNMPQLMYLLSKRHHVYLYGGPGSGKSTAAKMAADALGIRFGYISLNPQTPDSRLLGYMDANGNYRETLFYQLYKDGGIFCIDEMDNASASLLTTLNSCLENGHGAFPNGMVQRHEDFVVVATGNTAGRGANPQFPERRPFDSAFCERFTFIEWDYDHQLEEAVTLAINPNANSWLVWIRTVREYAKKNHPKLIVSPRASFRGAEYLKDSKWPTETIAEAVLFKGIDKDTKAAILNAHPVKGVK